MSREVKRICDRCGHFITDQPGSILEAKAGDLAKTPPDAWVDLCHECSGLFLDWLKAGRANQANHDGIGGALADRAVARMALA
jgi:hypothetical protein